MKKLFLYSVLILTMSAMSSIPQDSYAALRGDFSRDVNMKDVTVPDTATARMPFIKAWITNDALITVYFNYLLGDATVEVLDWAGATIAMTTCNTDVQASVELPVFLPEGTYTLRVIAKDYESVGDFHIY